MSENKRFYLDESGINDREYEFGILGEDELVVKQCNNCKYWRLGTASLNDNYCKLTGEWADYKGTCEE